MGQIVLIRHGQASFGADDYDVLSPTGWEQGRALGATLRDLSPSALLRGTMRRHRETLEAAAEPAGWSLGAAVVDERWNEFDHLAVVAAHPAAPDDGGSHGSLDRRAFQQLFEAATARWIAGEGDYVESFLDFCARVDAALDDARAAAGSGQTAVVVTSGGVIAVVAALMVGASGPGIGATWSRFNTVCVNTGLTRLVVGSTGTRLLTFNEHGHLREGLVTYR